MPLPRSRGAGVGLAASQGVVLGVVVALLGVPVAVRAECPNACSGNGVCDVSVEYEFCICEPPYMGADCSERRCERGLAWVDTNSHGDLDHDNLQISGGNDRTAATGARPLGTPTLSAVTPMERPTGMWERHPTQLYGTDSDALPMYVRKEEGHFYMECSNVGHCDRKTGICHCFTGFEGTACNRTACPNQCSGHGICKTMEQIVPSNTLYKLWDNQLHRGCDCDARWTGPDCSQRKCLHGDDPNVAHTHVRGVSEHLDENHESQRIKIACANNAPFGTESTIRLQYTDVQFGDTYETDELNVGSATDQSSAILAALRGLPNEVLASTPSHDQVVAVTRTISQDARHNPVYFYTVTFHHSLGDVPLMSAVTTGMVCKAGVVLPTGYRGAPWIENVGVEYDSSFLTLGPSADLTLTLETRVITDNAEEFSYTVELGAANAASPVFVAADNIPFFTGPDYLDDAIPNLLPMKFKFPEGNGGTFDPRGTVGTRYIMEFKAPAPAISIVTPAFENAETLPITYAVERLTGGSAENLYIEFSSPWNTPSSSLVATVTNTNTGTTPHQFDWSTDDGKSATGVDHHDGWSTLAGATSSDEIYKVKVAFEHGASGGRSQGAQWRFNAAPGYISGFGSSSNTEDIELRGNVAAAHDAIEEVNIIVQVAALNVAADQVQAGGANTDVYTYTLNGVEMGVYRIMDTWQTLGNSVQGQPSDANSVEVKFGLASKVSAARAITHIWRFSLLKLPIQQSWGYQETFRAHYFHSDITSMDARLFSPSADSKITFVIHILETPETTDKYRWKLSTDEVWVGSTASPIPFALGTTSTTGANTGTWTPANQVAARHGEVSNFALDLNGFDLLDGGSAERSCGVDAENAYYYLKIGDDGTNDFLECSGRGVCNRETGQCDCFGGFAQSDCHQSLRMAF